MGGKVIVSGEQSKYIGKWTYDINKLDSWLVETNKRFGQNGLTALAALVEGVTFQIDSESPFEGGKMLFTNVRYDGIVVGIEKQELDKFCIKL